MESGVVSHTCYGTAQVPIEKKKDLGYSEILSQKKKVKGVGGKKEKRKGKRKLRKKKRKNNKEGRKKKRNKGWV